MSRTTILVPIAALFIAAPLAAQEPVVLEVGDAAPVFQAPADDGTMWHSTDHVGDSILVVYFYPAAMTGGCTKQACAFRDDRSQLQELGAIVVGVSGDRLENLRIFKGQYQLNFPLLSDPNGVVMRAFGVPTRAGSTITRTIDGSEVELTRDLTAARWTFVIGRDGRVLFKETQVDAEGDSRAVMDAIRRLVAS
ncbi:MAG TPA: peroxiredoxin [Longimicrobiales bacterium]|nr:peroxiredoxin [Longimicrobiales bacterium]